MKGLAVFRSRAALGLAGYLAVNRIAGAAFPVVFVVCLAQLQGYAAAATAQAVTVVALASSAPLRARALDIWGSRRTLPAQFALSAASLTGVSVAIGHTRNLTAIIALSVLAAVSAPAIDPAVRTSWRSVAQGKEQLSLLHTADSLLEEAGFLVGPILAATLMLTVGYRWAPVIIALASCLNNLGAMSHSAVRRSLFVDAAPCAESHPGAAARRAGRSPQLAHTIMGPILRRDLREIVAPVVLMGGSFGVLAITLPSIAAHHGSMATSGFLTAVISLGGVAGGLAYGVLGTRSTPRIRQSLLGVLFGAPIALLLLARSPWLVALILLLGGLAVTPLYINSYLLIDGLIASDVKHEANSWVAAGNDVGYIVGISVGGLLLSKASLAAALMAAAGFGIVLAVVSLRGLIRRKHPEGSVMHVAAEDISV